MKEDEGIDMLMKSKKVKALVESRRSLNVTTWWLVRVQLDARSELAHDFTMLSLCFRGIVKLPLDRMSHDKGRKWICRRYSGKVKVVD